MKIRIFVIFFIHVIFLGLRAAPLDPVAPTPHEQLTGQFGDENEIDGENEVDPLQCFQVPGLDFQDPEDLRNKLKDRLAEKFHVRIAEDSPSFDPWFLFYLYLYLDHMKPSFEGDMTIHRTQETGPRLVRKDGNHLYFTENADRALVTSSFADAMQHYYDSWSIGGAAPSQEVRLSFTNTLFEQLNKELMTREQLEQYIGREYGISLKSSENEEDSYVSFSKKETNMILKQLSDLPKSIVRRLALDRIVRWPRGHKLASKKHAGSMAAARYEPESQRIILTDDAFADHGAQRTFFHEVGHALWQNLSEDLKKQFIDLSWEKKEESYQKKAGASFLTEYAATEPEEDFVEHFADYIYNNENLKTTTPLKYDFFKENLFQRTDYVDTAAENAKIELQTGCHDTTPPHIVIEEGKKILDIKSRIDGDRVELETTIAGVFDDVVGVKRICINLTSKDGEDLKYSQFTDAVCIDPKTGTYRTTCYAYLDLTTGGNYSVKSLALSDRAGNSVEVGIPETGPIFIPGTKQNKEKLPPRWIRNKSTSYRVPGAAPHILDISENRKKIVIVPQLITAGKENKKSYRVRLPMEKVDELEEISLRWNPTHFHGVTMHTILPQDWTVMRDSTTGEEFIQFDIEFPTQVPPGDMDLYSITVSYRETEMHRAERINVAVGGAYEGLSVKIQPFESTYTPPRIDVNHVELTEELQNDTRKIEVVVPVEGIENAAETGVRVDIRSPSGKRYTGYEFNDGTVELKNGKHYFKFKVNLPEFPEEGTYILESIECTESSSGGGGLKGSGHIYVDENLLEREVQKTIQIKPPDLN